MCNRKMADSSFPLHECVFNDDVRELSSLLPTDDINKKDKHGNTPLHLAIMLGRKGNAKIKKKNLMGWTPLEEAISYGDRQTILLLLEKLKHQHRKKVEERRPRLVSALKQMGDFYLQLKLDFQSWVPLLSRMFPSGICKIYKKGTKIRVDTTLLDPINLCWGSWDLSIIYNGEAEYPRSLFVLDNKRMVYIKARELDSKTEMQDELDILMGTDIVAAQMSTRCVTFNRAQTGFFFRTNKKGMVGSYKAEFYCVNGLVLEFRQRREHLTQEDLCKNKTLRGRFICKSRRRSLPPPSKTPFHLSRGHLTQEDLTQEDVSAFNTERCFMYKSRICSLPPPSKTPLSWNDYLNSNRNPILGRPLMSKHASKTYRATVAMCQDFPLSEAMLLDVLEAIAPVKLFAKVREFIETKLPPGFPVKVKVPLSPASTMRVSLQEFNFRNDLHDSFFQIPRYFMEKPRRFP